MTARDAVCPQAANEESPMSSKPVSIVSIMWGSYLPTFLQAAGECPGVSLKIFSQKDLEEDGDRIEVFFDQLAGAQVVLLYRTNDGFWTEIDARLPSVIGDRSLVVTSFDPSQWGQGPGADPAVGARAFAYISAGGVDNCRRLLDYLAHLDGDATVTVGGSATAALAGAAPSARPPGSTPSAVRTAGPIRAGGGRWWGCSFPATPSPTPTGPWRRPLIEALEGCDLDVLPVFLRRRARPGRRQPRAAEGRRALLHWS